MVKFTKGDCRGNGAGDVEKNKWSSSQRGIAGEMGQEMWRRISGQVHKGGLQGKWGRGCGDQ